VCHFSDWIEGDELDDTLATSVINKTQSHFARFGIPRICHTDNGPQFNSKDYMEFSSQYGFTHTTSSPYHSQGNCRAEAAVKVSEAMLKKSDDFQIATQDLTPCKCPTVLYPPPLPPPTLTYTPPTLLPRPGHNLAQHYNPLGSELNTPTDEAKQQPPPSSDTSNSDPDLNTSSPSPPQEPSTPGTGQSEPSTDTPTATIQDQPRDHQTKERTRTRKIKPPTRFKDFRLK